MPIHTLFATQIYSASLRAPGWQNLNRQLLRECRQLRRDDAAGRRWSAAHYPGGYTSYGSACHMHTVSPTFALLQRRLDRQVTAFARALEFDLRGRKLAMTDCWVNIMPRRVVHTLHLHPLSTLSGVYYVQTPPGSAALKFEDPRLERFMAAPPRRNNCSPAHRPWSTVAAQAGRVVLFESWLRHGVPPNDARGERISVSFNYSWF
jgi:uncharacterized protein (TIGR02466 family)